MSDINTSPVSPAADVSLAQAEILDAISSGGFYISNAKPIAELPPTVLSLAISHTLKGKHAEAAKAANDPKLNNIGFFALFDTASEKFQSALSQALPKMLGTICKDYAVSAAREVAPLDPAAKSNIGSLELMSIDAIKTEMQSALADGIAAILLDFASESQAGRKSAGALIYPQVAPFLAAIKLKEIQRETLTAQLQAGKIAPLTAWGTTVANGLMKRVRELEAKGEFNPGEFRRVITNLDPGFFAAVQEMELTFD